MSTPVSDSPLRVPDEIGSMYGWRTWSVNRKTLQLQPLVVRDSSSWARSTTQAKCAFSTHHKAPAQHCKCGLYGAKRPMGAMNTGHYPRGVLPSRPGLVLGQVRLWGRLIEYEDGYRAEHAEVVSLVDDGTRLTRRVAARYNVDLIPSPSTKMKFAVIWAVLSLIWMWFFGSVWVFFATLVANTTHVGHVFLVLVFGLVLGFFTLCFYALGGILRVRFLFPKRRR